MGVPKTYRLGRAFISRFQKINSGELKQTNQSLTQDKIPYFYIMTFIKTTEQDSNYNHLEKMDISELLQNINAEDKTVPLAVEKALPQIELLVEQIVQKLQSGGRLFYLGAGTSGRLGILDASE